MALSPKDLLTSSDMEDFASDYLRLSGIETDMFYESYMKLNVDDICIDELEQDTYEY